ncbi:hypothetical protein FKM82_029929 [Ascaphus truei]
MPARVLEVPGLSANSASPYYGGGLPLPHEVAMLGQETLSIFIAFFSQTKKRQNGSSLANVKKQRIMGKHQSQSKELWEGINVVRLQSILGEATV